MTEFSLIVVYQLFNFPTTYNNIPKKGPLGTSPVTATRPIWNTCTTSSAS